jgi:site-specific DNA recombinase
MQMRAAIYARVSTPHQDRDQTIESQLGALEAWVAAQGHNLDPTHIYADVAYSGSRLDRPALDRLRDDAAAAAFDLVAVVSPDRLARKYAYQVLLLEEFRRAGCDVAFLQRPITDDPHDQLLLQIQGAIAEYERAVLGERFRRGKLHKARAGQWLGTKAPYGYRYVPKREGVPGHLVVDEDEAAFVRLLYGWLIDEQMTVRQILKRLNAGPWIPRSGHQPWSNAVVHHILSDPIYTGTAYVNRYRFVPPAKPRRPESPRAHYNVSRQPRPREEWIAVPVPALIDQQTHERAQEQLARNAQLSFRHNTRHDYLLRCLLTCGVCGLAMFGVYQKSGEGRRYYVCRGKDRLFSARTELCPRSQVRAEDIEAAVWAHIVGLLTDPAALIARFQEQARLATEGDAHERAAAEALRVRLARLEREDGRLLDAYQAEVISLEELTQRRRGIAERRRALEEQRLHQERLRRQRAHAAAVLADLSTFCERVRTRLAQPTFADKQALLHLLIERIIVGEDTLEIRHVIPLGGTEVGRSSPDPPFRGLRSDGMDATPLPPRPQEDFLDGLLDARMRVADHQLDAAHAPRDQALQEGPPHGHVLGEANVQAQDLTHPVGAHPVGNDDGHGLHAMVFTHMLVAGIDPDVGIIRIEPPGAEGRHLGVEASRHAADFALADPSNA